MCFLNKKLIIDEPIKEKWGLYYVKGYPIVISNTSQERAEKQIAEYAIAYTKYLNTDILYKGEYILICEIPHKSNDYIFKLKSGVILGWDEFRDLIEFNEFLNLKWDFVMGTQEELEDIWKVYKEFNNGWSDKIGVTYERVKVFYNFYKVNKNMGISSLIRNNPELLKECDRKYFQI